MAWVRMRPTTWTTGASSATISGAGRRGVDRPPPGSFDGLEGLDKVVEAADGPVVVVDRTADLGQGGKHRDGSTAARLGQQGQSSGEGWSAMATWRPISSSAIGITKCSRAMESGIRASAWGSGAV